MSVTTITRIRARIDRLPSALSIALAGVVLQVLLAVVLLGLAYGSDNQVRLVVGAFLAGIVALAVLAALPILVLLYLGRYPRTAAALATIVALGTLVLTEAHPTIWPLPAALLAAGVRAWAGAGLTAERIADVDPGRLERVHPPGSPGHAPSPEQNTTARPPTDSNQSRATGEPRDERHSPSRDDRSTDSPNRDDRSADNQDQTGRSTGTERSDQGDDERDYR